MIFGEERFFGFDMASVGPIGDLILRFIGIDSEGLEMKEDCLISGWWKKVVIGPIIYDEKPINR